METMQNPGMPTGKEIGTVIYWYTNQIALTFHLHLSPTSGKQDIINKLPFDQLNALLKTRGVTLQSFGPIDVPRGNGGAYQMSAYQNNNLKDPVAKYLFPSPDDEGSILIGFFHIVPDADNGDHTTEIVNLINNTKNIGEVQTSAMPNWLSAGTGDVGHGCPITPPVPVEKYDRCAADPGYWPIAVPELPDDLQQEDGNGVTVLVLDTFPQRETIATALNQLPEGANKLLKDMATSHQSLNSLGSISL